MLSLVLLLSLLQAPAAAPDSVPPARIEMTTPFPVHLGTVGPREAREAVYGIRSVHDRPFRLRVLDLSVGLTLDEAQLAAPLQPGEVRTVRVKVDPTGLEGPIKGAVRLGTDDPAQPNYILRYDMLVRPEASVDAERRSFGDVLPHERPEVAFHFRREGGDPLKLVLASELPPYLEAELAPAGDSADLRLKLRPAALKPGVAAGLEVVKVATNVPRQPVFTLYADWRLALPVVATPSRLVFADMNTAELDLELTARDGRPFRLGEVAIEGAGFTLVDGPHPDGPRHVLRVRRTGTQAEAMLLVGCSNLDAPLKVPLRFLDPKAPAEAPRPLPPPPPEHHHDHPHPH